VPLFSALLGPYVAELASRVVAAACDGERDDDDGDQRLYDDREKRRASE
jgi:hypothetical protein